MDEHDITGATPEAIFKEVSQEQIMNYFLAEYGIYVSENRYLSPFRYDKKPDCVFYYQNNKLYFHDLADERYDVWDIIMKKKGIKNFGSAILYFKKHHLARVKEGLIDTSPDAKIQYIDPKKVKSISKKQTHVRVKRKLFSKRELLFWCIGGLAVSPKQLENDGIYAIESFWLNDKKFSKLDMAFCYHYGGYKYQIYQPLRPKGTRHTVVPCSYGDLSLVPTFFPYIVITKSKKDAFILRRLGVCAIHVLSESILIGEEVINLLRSRYDIIFTLFDNDRQGIKQSRVYRERYGTTPLWYPRDSKNNKDTYDNLKYYGLNEILEFIQILSEQYEISQWSII